MAKTGQSAREAVVSKALLLKSTDIREADRIVTLISEEKGRVSLACRGVRKSKRRFPGGIEPFSVLTVEMVFGTSRVGTLRSANITRAFPHILEDLTRMAYASYGLEVIGELLPEQEQDRSLFELAVELLAEIDRPDAHPMTAGLQVAIRALSVGGFRPEMDTCAVTGQPAPHSVSAYFDPHLGSIVSRKAGGARHLLSAKSRTFLRSAADGVPWHAIEPLASEELARLWTVTKEFAEAQLGSRLRAANLVSQVEEIA